MPAADVPVRSISRPEVFGLSVGYVPAHTLEADLTPAKAVAWGSLFESLLSLAANVQAGRWIAVARDIKNIVAALLEKGTHQTKAVSWQSLLKNIAQLYRDYQDNAPVAVILDDIKAILADLGVTF